MLASGLGSFLYAGTIAHGYISRPWLRSKEMEFLLIFLSHPDQKGGGVTGVIFLLKFPSTRKGTPT